jgi:hypothetical protein
MTLVKEEVVGVRRTALANRKSFLDMGTNGTNTITALKAATGIADDRLSAHHPNGTGNPTAIGDFLVDAVGRYSSGTLQFETDLERVFSTPSILAQGTNNEDFEVQVDFAYPTGTPTGDLWRNQIGIGGSNLVTRGSDFIEQGRVSGSLPDAGRDSIRIQCKLNATGSVRVEVELTGSLNNDATNHNTTLIYDSTNDGGTEVWGPSPRVWRIEADEGSSGDDLFLTMYEYDPNGQITGYMDWEINPQQTLTGDQGSAQVSSGTAQDTANISGLSTGTHTLEVVLRDGQGGTAQDSHQVDFEKTGGANSTIFQLTDLH